MRAKFMGKVKGMRIKTIKFKNKKAYEAYKFILDTCDSNNQCAFCPFFNGEAKCVFQECSPLVWPQAELECDTCPVKNSCDEVTEVDVVDYIHSNMDAAMWKEVAEEKIKQIEELKKHIANLDETICKQEEQLSESYDASHIKVRDDMIFSLEKQLSDARNELAADRDLINTLKKWLAEKARYIAKLKQQIASAKEVLKDD